MPDVAKPGLLTDPGAAFLTGIPLALFYVVCRIPIAWLADRSNRRHTENFCHG